MPGRFYGVGAFCVCLCVHVQDAGGKDADMFCLIVMCFFFCLMCEGLCKCTVSSNLCDYRAYVNLHRIFAVGKNTHLLHVFYCSARSHPFQNLTFNDSNLLAFAEIRVHTHVIVKPSINHG